MRRKLFWHKIRENFGIRIVRAGTGDDEPLIGIIIDDVGTAEVGLYRENRVGTSSIAQVIKIGEQATDLKPRIVEIAHLPCTASTITVAGGLA